jgi:hypothetical protein
MPGPNYCIAQSLWVSILPYGSWGVGGYFAGVDYTGIAPHWLAVFGYVLSLLLLFGSYDFSWSFLAFPLWVFLISASILRDSLRRRTEPPATVQS